MKYSPTEFLKAVTNTAEHFGFRTADNFKNEPLCKNCNTSLSHNITEEDKYLDTHNGLLTNSIATFCEKSLYALNAPVLLYSLDQDPDNPDTAVSFTIFNVPKSIAEAILIQVGRSLMQELGHTDQTVRINSLGDAESTTRYYRELANFLKKRLDIMPETAREMMKVHPFKALEQLITEDHELAYKCPKPLEFLSDQSRKHFREIIEYLDMTETAYEIDPRMLSNHEYYSDALFSIEDTNLDQTDPQYLTVRGGRYDEFVFKKLKTRIPAVGTVISLKSPTKTPTRLPKGKVPKPDVFVVQLGFGAKIRSLMIIDQLRKAGIPVRHDLSSDSLSTQLREAEDRGVKYSIIIGQKEFVERTVILRNMKERNQENISSEQMVRKLKRQLATS